VGGGSQQLTTGSETHQRKQDASESENLRNAKMTCYDDATEFQTEIQKWEDRKGVEVEYK